jgi:hypothetical protein
MSHRIAMTVVAVLSVAYPLFRSIRLCVAQLSPIAKLYRLQKFVQISSFILSSFLYVKKEN